MKTQHVDISIKIFRGWKNTNKYLLNKWDVVQYVGLKFSGKVNVYVRRYEGYMIYEIFECKLDVKI